MAITTDRSVQLICLIVIPRFIANTMFYMFLCVSGEISFSSFPKVALCLVALQLNIFMVLTVMNHSSRPMSTQEFFSVIVKLLLFPCILSCSAC